MTVILSSVDHIHVVGDLTRMFFCGGVAFAIYDLIYVLVQHGSTTQEFAGLYLFITSVQVIYSLVVCL
jgi:hypothetical protein